MKPFDIGTSGFTAESETVVFPVNANYDVTILDNPVRKKTSAAVISANLFNYRQQVTL